MRIGVVDTVDDKDDDDRDDDKRRKCKSPITHGTAKRTREITAWAMAYAK